MSSESRPLTCRDVVICFAAMILTFIVLVCVAVSYSSGNWVATTATVDSTQIKSTRPGYPAWSLMVDFHYTVEGQTFKKTNVDIKHNTEREDTERLQELWPAGRTFTIYYSAGQPNTFSLQDDGNREVGIVLATIMTPLVTMFWLIPIVLIRRVLKRNLGNPSQTADA